MRPPISPGAPARPHDDSSRDRLADPFFKPRGDNAGGALPHKDVVDQMIFLGHWRGVAAAFPLPAGGAAGLAEAAIVQTAGAGPFLAAARR
jgi:hypothetical protein